MEQPKEKIEPITTPLRAVPKRPSLAKLLPIVIVVVLVGAGIFTGLIISSRNKSADIASRGATIEEKNLTPEQKESFQQVTRDSAEGIIEKNDKFEETAQGQWKLIREGGESQTAYLTSSFLDLDEYVGKKVKVYGETLGTDKVAWLMDVARVEEIQ